MSNPQEQDLEGIAVIGMACRFPGASDVETFWRNLCGAEESITTFSDKQLLEAGVHPLVLQQPNYVKAAPVLDGIEEFDAAFFELSPREAAITDPQHRLFLECAWEALEDAGYDAERFEGRIGLFAGMRQGGYLLSNLLLRGRALGDVDPLQVLIGNDKDYLPTQVSYRLNLTGPSIGVQTACSTALVAASLACQSLTCYQSDLALAGAAAVRVPQIEGYFHSEGSILSPDGHCRAFDAEAAGTVFGSGLGVVLLKRLEDAVADGDHVYAVIRAVAVNNDGSAKVGFSAPGLTGQSEVIAGAQALAGVEPESITYLEAHGTGTHLGDPVEFAALREVFDTGSGDRGFCALGSVKTNVGHLDTAAGAAGLIKTALALKHRQLPPSLHFQRPNPQISLDDSPFYVNTRLSDWETERLPRRAGVSSFGMGGTNAHAVLEEAPDIEPSGPSRRWQLILVSAKRSEALEAVTTRLAAHLRRQPEQAFADIAFTLQQGRRVFDHRRFVVCRDRNDAIHALERADPRRLMSLHEKRRNRPVVYMFPGQGSQYAGMGADLYQTEPVFRREVDRCSEILAARDGRDLRTLLYPEEATESDLLERTEFSQPALFTTEYALARLWMSWGVEPQAMVGHSLGEYVAACLAGVFELSDALALVAVRGRLMQEMPEGDMLSVLLPAVELEPRLPAGVSLAAVNGPVLSVVSGPRDEVERLRRSLEEEGVRCRPLHTSHAFHSATMDPVLARFVQEVARFPLQPPKIPFLSNLTGDWITDSEATDPGYWARHLRQPVRFGDALEVLFQEPGRVLLEVGPGRTLGTFARRHGARPGEQAVMHSIRHPDDPPQGDDRFLLHTLGRLWLSGVPVNWKSFSTAERRRRVSLPTYPWQRGRHWVEPLSAEERQSLAAALTGSGIGLKFLLPVWQQSMPPLASRGAAGNESWLIFADSAGLGEAIARRLRPAGGSEEQVRVTTVVAADRFARIGPRRFSIHPRDAEGYLALMGSLAETVDTPSHIVHAWSVDPGLGEDAASPHERWRTQHDLGFGSLLFLAQALGEAGFSAPLRLDVLVSELFRVTGDERLRPEKATLLGPARVIPQEYPGISCRTFDVATPTDVSARDSLADLLIAEFTAERPDPLVAYRGRQRWVQSLEPVELAAIEGPGPRLRSAGVYLITGGLGGIGLTVARHLATTVHAKLVLIGRTPLPARDDWDRWLVEHGENDLTSRKVLELRDLEQRGAEVLAATADVTDPDEMRKVLEQTRQRFGELNGLIHAAGVPGSGAIQLKSPEATQAILAPKVAGTLVLDEVLGEAEPDFIVLCSSTIALTGGIGQVDYCAANAFLDAFAHGRRDRAGFLVSINWDAWSEVGMAFREAERAGGRTAGEPPAVAAESSAEEIDHPLFDRRFSSDAGDTVFVTDLDPARHWVLDEHRLQGRPVLAGTVSLEMARAAFRQGSREARIEILDVFFLSPLEVGPEHQETTYTFLSATADGSAFSIRTRSGDVERPQWREHVTGHIRPLAEHTPPQHHIAEILERCSAEVIDVDPAAAFDPSSPVYWGPRWQSVRKLHLGREEGVAVLELPSAFAGDLEAFAMHPALLDVATASGVLALDQGVFLPLSYGLLRVWEPLPARVLSHFVRREGSSVEQAVVYDVTIMDDSGKELIAVEGLVLRRVEAAAAAAERSDPGEQAAVPERSAAAAARGGVRGLSDAEGLDALRRVLDSATFPQVVVTTRALKAATGREPGYGAAADTRPAETETAIPPQRRPVETDYVAPRDEIERSLAELWQQALGFDQIGVYDNFFELGGHSVLAIQLISKLREFFEIEIPLNVLFDAPTIADLTQVILRRFNQGIDPTEVDEALAEIESLTDQEVEALVGLDDEKRGRGPT